jgi:hypothetical protein
LSRVGKNIESLNGADSGETAVGGAYLEEPFERTIEVSDEMTLGTLQDTIQELTGFDNDHCSRFSWHAVREDNEPA